MRSQAENLLACILNVNFLTFLPFWFEILEQVNRIQKRLQDPKMNFHESSKDIKALQIEMSDKRETLPQDAIEVGKGRCTDWGIETEQRRRRRKKISGEEAGDAGLSSQEQPKRILQGVIDYFSADMVERFTRLSSLDEKFGFMLDITFLIENVNSQVLLEKCMTLSNFYSSDIDGEELYRYIYDGVILLKSRSDVSVQDPLDILSFITCYGDDVFQNLLVALQILLTIACSIASCERSSSKLKLILSNLRVAMSQIERK